MIDFGTNESFIANYEKLKSSRKMGALYHCDKGSITSHAKKIGYDYTKHKKIKITVPPEELMQMYLELGSVKKVAEKFNCSSTAVINCLKKAGYNLENVNAKLAHVTDEEFISAYNELKSAAKVGLKFNCSSTSILNHAKKIGYNVNTCKDYQLSEEAKQDIINNYNYISSNKLAEKYKVSRGMITKIWYDSGLLNKNINTERTYIDLTGQTFGLWTVLEESDERTCNGGIKWKCRCKCGIEKNVDSASLRNGTSLSCGAHANISHGNEKVKQLLQKAQIPFEIEKKFDTCKDKKEMPFDFWVNNHYLIEYDGEQHFNTQSCFDYEYTHRHDLIKNQWCKEHNIPLIRIPYTHYDDLCIEDLLLETSKYIVIMPTIN